MRNKFTYNLVLQHDATSSSGGRSFGNSGGKSRSRYQGGFVKKNGRLNNSSAYNHDYYINNKNKWAHSRVRSSGFASINDTTKKLAYYMSVGEKEIFGDWSPEKFEYVQNSPGFQEAFDKWEEAENYYQYTGDRTFKAESDKAGVKIIEEMIRLGDEYDKENGIEPSSHNYTPSSRRRPGRGGQISVTHDVKTKD